MSVIESLIAVSEGSGKNLDTAQMTTSAGVVEREGVFVGDSEFPERRAKVDDRNNLYVGGEALNELLVLFPRLFPLLKSNAVVDASNRQRVAVETCVISSGTVTAVTTVGTVTNAVPIGNVATIAGMDREMYRSQARTSFNTGIRSNMNWS